jgi:hypothetical protein
LAIKNGAWSYDRLVEYADRVEDEVKLAYQNSTLPNQPNVKLLDELCMQIAEAALVGE